MAVRPGDLLKTLLDIIFPPRCRVCETSSRIPLCDACLSGIERITGPICHSCGAPFDPSTHHGDLCADCRQGSGLDRARSVCRFTGLIRKAIHRYKYDSVRELADPLGELLCAYLESGFRPGPTADPYYTEPRAISLEEVDLIVPVPLFPARERDRGFNQARLLVDRVAARFNVPAPGGVLIRTRDTTPQINLKARERKRNVRGAFEVVEAGPVRDRTVLLVDDVCTTGATLGECSKMLKRAGADRVFALTLARQSSL